MSKSTNQYAAHCAARGVREPGRVQGVTFRAARTTPPGPDRAGMRARAAELRAEAARLIARAEELELAAGS